MTKLRAELRHLGKKKRKEEMLSGLKDNTIPSPISIQQPSRLVTMPLNQIESHVDPQEYVSRDWAKGVNPDSRFHWNKDKPKKRGKRKESKVLETYKRDRNKRKTKRKKSREKYFGP